MYVQNSSMSFKKKAQYEKMLMIQYWQSAGQRSVVTVKNVFGIHYLLDGFLTDVLMGSMM